MLYLINTGPSKGHYRIRLSWQLINRYEIELRILWGHWLNFSAFVLLAFVLCQNDASKTHGTADSVTNRNLKRQATWKTSWPPLSHLPSQGAKLSRPAFRLRAKIFFSFPSLRWETNCEKSPAIQKMRNLPKRLDAPFEMWGRGKNDNQTRERERER